MVADVQPYPPPTPTKERIHFTFFIVWMGRVSCGLGGWGYVSKWGSGGTAEKNGKKITACVCTFAFVYQRDSLRTA